MRPRSFETYVGQGEIKRNLRVFVNAARAREQALDHVLFSGPPGLGKTTLSRILAQELGVGLRATAGPVLERQGDLAAILTNLAPREVLFIDEIHRLPRPVEEVFYQAMEDFFLDIVVGQGPMARTVKLKLPPFTLVGATTRLGLLTAPLRERFGIQYRLHYYAAEELVAIIQRSAEVLGLTIVPEAGLELARRSRGTPRVANRLLRRAGDFAHAQGTKTLALPLVKAALDQMGVDPLGLEELHTQLLRVLIDQFDGGPVGLTTLTAALSEPRDTIEDVYEPYLIQQGLIKKTPRGRVATARAYAHFNLRPPLNFEERQLPLPER